MFKSVELFWPKNIGDIILILDKGEEDLTAGVAPSYVKIFYESFPKGVPGKDLYLLIFERSNGNAMEQFMGR
jgi:hypothetical protein